MEEQKETDTTSRSHGLSASTAQRSSMTLCLYGSSDPHFLRHGIPDGLVSYRGALASSGGSQPYSKGVPGQGSKGGNRFKPHVQTRSFSWSSKIGGRKEHARNKSRRVKLKHHKRFDINAPPKPQVADTCEFCLSCRPCPCGCSQPQDRPPGREPRTATTGYFGSYQETQATSIRDVA